MASIVGYNPSDPIQQGFLAALAQGEVGSSGDDQTAFEGTGGTNLAGLSTDQYGFPVWSGLGNSHAAGTYQFQPSTWDTIAQQFNLNFQNPADQAEGAWYYAQQVFAQNSGGQSLEAALQSGEFSSVQSALASVWPSVTGNQANPTGLASILPASINTSANNNPDVAGSAANAATSAPSSSSGGPTGVGFIDNAIGGASNLFARGGLIVLGLILVFVAAWALLSETGYVPSPRQTFSKL